MNEQTLKRDMRKRICLLLMAMTAMTAWAQGDDFGLWTSIEVQKKIAAEDATEATKIANAKNLLQEGDSPEKIARCCSLPLEQVLALKEELMRENIPATM